MNFALFDGGKKIQDARTIPVEPGASSPPLSAAQFRQ
jgi:hypothetical protein